MSETLRSIVREHHAFYEVRPYYEMLITYANGGLSPTTRRVHAGFDIDIYGENLTKEWVIPGPDPDYRIGYSELKTIADELSRHATHSCSLEVIEYPATIYFDRHGKLQALVRIRISHWRGLSEPAGLPEQRALEELQNELKDLGLARR